MTRTERLKARYENPPKIDRPYGIDDYLRGVALGAAPADYAGDLKYAPHGPEVQYKVGFDFAHNLRRAKLDAAYCDLYPIEFGPDEQIVGRRALEYVLTDEQNEIAKIGRERWKACGPYAGLEAAATAHRVVDYEKLINRGIDSILDEVREKLDALDYTNPEDSAKEAFYGSVKLSLEAFLRLAARVRDAILIKAASEPDIKRKAELTRMAHAFDDAPAKPCAHFRDALQMVWLLECYLALTDDTSLTGRLDDYLYPFYEKDRASGEITYDEAFELIEEIYIKHNELYGTWPASIMVGGVKRDGSPCWNDLSEMCVDAIGTTGLVNPSVNICWTKDMPEALMDKALRLLENGYSRPAFFNDRVIQEGLIAAGVSETDARYYIHSTCVEITPIAASNIQVATPYINLSKAFEYILGEGESLYGAPCKLIPKVEARLSELTTFEKFYDKTLEVMRAILRAELSRVTRSLYTISHYASSPLASAFLNDCIARGTDAGAGGARYSFVYPCFPGFLNVVDSLAAVRKAVYEDKMMSLAEMRDLLKGNFDGKERTRQYLVNRCPKIGNGIDEVDQICVAVYDFIRAEISKYRTDVNATFHPSFFAWIQHGYFGRVAAATPDGREQGAALSECLGAVQGRDVNGPTGVLRSIAKIDQKYGIGGIATNMRFTKRLMGSEEGREAVKKFIEEFMAQDCFEIQLNVVDQATLLDAKAHPEKHKNLMVRVAGYSDYFVDLIPEIQDEILMRSEYDGV